jgi:alpha-glucosidase
MIESIPSVWDETIVLPPSEIGEVALFARRRADRWFVAAMNGSQARTVTIDLSFLGAGTYKGLIVRDEADDPAAVDMETPDIARGHELTIAMRAGGGFVLRLSK